MRFRLSLPIAALLFASVVYLGAEVFAAGRGDELSVRASELYFLLVGFLLSWWIARDKQHTRFSGFFDLHFYILFFWLLVVPYYLLRTRGMSGLIPIALLLMLAFAPVLVGFGFWITSSP